MKPKRIKEFSDQIAYRYFVKKAQSFPKHALSTPAEKMRIIRGIKNRTMFFSALYGALGVLLLYIPQYIFPDYFPVDDFSVLWGLIEFRLSLNDLYYGVFLTAAEIWLLVLTDLRSVGRIAAAYGFPRHDAADTREETEKLLDIGLGKDTKLHTEVGINPLQKTSKAGVYILFIIFRIKAILSKFVFRYVLKKLLGRLAVRSVLDMVGIPVYAFWNAQASAVVIRKANMRMYAHKLIDEAGVYFFSRYKDNNTFRNLIYDHLEFIAMTKKSFYPTDYFFAKHFLTLFKIPIENEHKLSDEYFEKLKNLPSGEKKDVAKFLLIGFLADGKLGSLEIRGIKELQTEGLIPFSIEQIKDFTKKYTQGYGFTDMLKS